MKSAHPPRIATFASDGAEAPPPQRRRCAHGERLKLTSPHIGESSAIAPLGARGPRAEDPRRLALFGANLARRRGSTCQRTEAPPPPGSAATRRAIGHSESCQRSSLATQPTYVPLCGRLLELLHSTSAGRRQHGAACAARSARGHAGPQPAASDRCGGAPFPVEVRRRCKNDHTSATTTRKVAIA